MKHFISFILVYDTKDSRIAIFLKQFGEIVWDSAVAWLLDLWMMPTISLKPFFHIDRGFIARIDSSSPPHTSTVIYQAIAESSRKDLTHVYIRINGCHQWADSLHFDLIWLTRRRSRRTAHKVIKSHRLVFFIPSATSSFQRFQDKFGTRPFNWRFIGFSA